MKNVLARLKKKKERENKRCPWRFLRLSVKSELLVILPFFVAPLDLTGRNLTKEEVITDTTCCSPFLRREVITDTSVVITRVNFSLIKGLLLMVKRPRVERYC